MSKSKADARPSQVTMAGWMAAVGSAFLVVSLFDVMSNVRSIEIREASTSREQPRCFAV